MKSRFKKPTPIREQANNLVTDQTNAVSTTFPHTYFLILIQTLPSAVISDKITDFRSQLRFHNDSKCLTSNIKSYSSPTARLYRVLWSL